MEGPQKRNLFKSFLSKGAEYRSDSWQRTRSLAAILFVTREGRKKGNLSGITRGKKGKMAEDEEGVRRN